MYRPIHCLCVYMRVMRIAHQQNEIFQSHLHKFIWWFDNGIARISAQNTNEKKNCVYSLSCLVFFFLFLFFCKSIKINAILVCTRFFTAHSLSPFSVCFCVYIYFFSCLLVEPCRNRVSVLCLRTFFFIWRIANKWFVCYFALRSYHFINVWVHRLNYIDRHELFMRLCVREHKPFFFYSSFFSFSLSPFLQWWKVSQIQWKNIGAPNPNKKVLWS